ncbi:hypothetical protein HDU91_001806, partial [Kappamyces sp. JEL0680]
SYDETALSKQTIKDPIALVKTFFKAISHNLELKQLEQVLPIASIAELVSETLLESHPVAKLTFSLVQLSVQQKLGIETEEKFRVVLIENLNYLDRSLIPTLHQGHFHSDLRDFYFYIADYTASIKDCARAELVLMQILRNSKDFLISSSDVGRVFLRLAYLYRREDDKKSLHFAEKAIELAPSQSEVRYLAYCITVNSSRYSPAHLDAIEDTLAQQTAASRRSANLYLNWLNLYLAVAITTSSEHHIANGFAKLCDLAKQRNDYSGLKKVLEAFLTAELKSLTITNTAVQVFQHFANDSALPPDVGAQVLEKLQLENDEVVTAEDKAKQLLEQYLNGNFENAFKSTSREEDIAKAVADCGLALEPLLDTTYGQIARLLTGLIQFQQWRITQSDECKTAAQAYLEQVFNNVDELAPEHIIAACNAMLTLLDAGQGQDFFKYIRLYQHAWQYRKKEDSFHKILEAGATGEGLLLSTVAQSPNETEAQLDKYLKGCSTILKSTATVLPKVVEMR